MILNSQFSLLSPYISKASSRIGRSSGKSGPLPMPRPSWCATFGSGMLIRFISQSMSSQRSDRVSEGDRSPPSLARSDLPRLELPFTIRSEEKQMTLEQLLSEISSLTPSEQLKIAQVIWDRLPDEFGTDISPAQQAELDRRWIEYKKDPSSALTLEEFRERMRVARGK